MSWIALDPMPAEKPPWPKGARAWFAAIHGITFTPGVAIIKGCVFIYLYSTVMSWGWHLSGLVLATIEGR